MPLFCAKQISFQCRHLSVCARNYQRFALVRGLDFYPEPTETLNHYSSIFAVECAR